MDRELLSWQDNAEAIDELIARASKTIDIVDTNLRMQGWETRARADALKDAMHVRGVHVRIALLDAKHLSTEFPRLTHLLKTHGHRLTILGTHAQPEPAQFFAVADRQHSIFRPVLVRSQGFCYFDSREKSIGYANNFKLIWEQGGDRVFPEAFGL
jgi:hypothetical protein